MRKSLSSSLRVLRYALSISLGGLLVLYLLIVDVTYSHIYYFEFRVRDSNLNGVTGVNIGVTCKVQEGVYKGALRVKESNDRYLVRFWYKRKIFPLAPSFLTEKPQSFSISTEKEGFRRQTSVFPTDELYANYLKEDTDNTSFFELPDFVLKARG